MRGQRTAAPIYRGQGIEEPATSTKRVPTKRGQTTPGSGTGSTVVSGVQSVASRTALANANGLFPAFLTEAGREGIFTWNGSDLSAMVAADAQQGVYVPPTGQDGSSGAWVRQFVGSACITWFGATGAGPPTNDAPAIQASFDWSKAARLVDVADNYGVGAGPPIYVPDPAVKFYCAGTTLVMDHTFKLHGNSSGDPTSVASVLQWDGTCTGIHPTSNAPGHQIYGLTLLGGFAGGAEGEFHAISPDVVGETGKLNVRDWPGDAVNEDESDHAGQTNGYRIDGMYTENVRCSHKSAGGDANAGEKRGIQSKFNRQCGVFQASFLGDHYYSGSHNGAARSTWNTGLTGHPASYCHVAGHRYAVIGGQETWCSTNAPSGTTASNQGWKYWQEGPADTNGVPTWFSGMECRVGGAYVQQGLSNGSTFNGCYAEDNNPSQFDRYSVLVNPFMSYKWLVSAGALYGDKDHLSGDSFQFTAAASPSGLPVVTLGQSIIQDESTTSLCDFWNLQSLGGGINVAVRFQLGLEADGVTRANLARIYAASTTSDPATAAVRMYFGTRTYAGGGAITDWVVLDGNNQVLGPVTDNNMDHGTAAARWKTTFAYVGDFKTSVKINGTVVLNGQMSHTADLTAPPTAADFNALLAKLQAVQLMA